MSNKPADGVAGDRWENEPHLTRAWLVLPYPYSVLR